MLILTHMLLGCMFAAWLDLAISGPLPVGLVGAFSCACEYRRTGAVPARAVRLPVTAAGFAALAASHTAAADTAARLHGAGHRCYACYSSARHARLGSCTAHSSVCSFVMPVALRRAKVVITATGVWRGPRTMALKSIVDKALAISKQGGHQVKSRPRVIRQAANRCVWSSQYLSIRQAGH